MIIIKRANDWGEMEAVLAYNGETEELWGYEAEWEGALPKVGLSENEFAKFYDGPRYFAAYSEEEVDPFEDMPNIEPLLRNYPPGSEDIPDRPTPEPLGEGYQNVVPEEDREGPADKAAESAADAAVESLEESGTGNLKTAEKSNDGLSVDGYEYADDFMRDMHKRLAEWDGDDLSKAPMAWPADEQVPEFVKEVIRQVIQNDVVWDDFSGYTRQAARAIQNSLRDNLTQPQGWSIESLVRDLQSIYPGMDDEQAHNIARTETSAVLNSAREEAYKKRPQAANYVYYWSGPADHRRTDVCKEIVNEVESRGGSVPMNELRSILRSKARKYENTDQGGTPERVSEWCPHYQCRHTFVRDVKADL